MTLIHATNHLGFCLEELTPAGWTSIYCRTDEQEVLQCLKEYRARYPDKEFRIYVALSEPTQKEQA